MELFMHANGSPPWFVSSLLREHVSLVDSLSQTIEYLTQQLILNYGVDSKATGFVDEYDFWIFPFVNPDGTSTAAPKFRGLETNWYA